MKINEEFPTTQRENYQEIRGNFQGGNYERSGRSDVIPRRSLSTVSMKNIGNRLYNESMRFFVEAKSGIEGRSAG